VISKARFNQSGSGRAQSRTGRIFDSPDGRFIAGVGVPRRPMRRQEVLTITVQMILHVERVVVVGCSRRWFESFCLTFGWGCGVVGRVV
jgi:hypothetical protein